MSFPVSVMLCLLLIIAKRKIEKQLNFNSQEMYEIKNLNIFKPNKNSFKRKLEKKNWNRIKTKTN